MTQPVPSPTVLAVDTAQERCAVALRVAGATAVTRTLAEPKGHAEALLPLIGEVLAQANLQYRDVHLLAATTGPGVFTGVRVGLAAVRGLRLALGIPALGIGTLPATAATARAAGVAGAIATVNDARRDEVYLQTFTAHGEPNQEAVLIPLSEASGHLRPEMTVVGTAVPPLRGLLADTTFQYAAVERPDVGIVAAMAEALYAAADLPQPRPLYVRPPHITQPRGAAQ